MVVSAPTWYRSVSTTTADFRVYPHTEWENLKAVWAAVYASAPGRSFFVGPEWTDCWMGIFGSILKPEILVFETDGRPIGAALLIRRREHRGPIPVHRCYLNTAGEDLAESPYLEFNDLVCRPGTENAIAHKLREHVLAGPFDELRVNGMLEGPSFAALTAVFGDLNPEVQHQSSRYIDLAKLRAADQSFEASLGSKYRQQLRQNLRKYGEFGELRLEVATSPARALEMFAELGALKQATWQERGRTSAFVSPRFVGFHRDLIQRVWAANAILMVCATAGDELIGLVYNIVHEGKAYSYQSGLRYRDDKRLKPGFVAVALTINHCLGSGLREYDLMAGDGWQADLSPDYRDMSWVVFRKPSLKLTAIESLKALRAAVGRGGK
jgi:CelD/BcsL family acetyltransferase involved in cellulose biosynthesis